MNYQEVRTLTGAASIAGSNTTKREGVKRILMVEKD